MASKIEIRQIYYDAATKSSLDPDFIPLDNSKNERPDWYEFWVIKSFLDNNELEDDCWYGFLSPKFKLKTGFSGEYIRQQVAYADQAGAQVVLPLSHWFASAFYQNCFEQGEQAHPGLLSIAQEFIAGLGLAVDLRTLVTHTSNFAYCNYVIAKKDFWQKWHRLAQAFFAMAEQPTSELAARLRSATRYLPRGVAPEAPMKVFIQERFPAILMQQHNFPSYGILSEEKIYQNHMVNIGATGLLITLNNLKIKYTETGNPQFIHLFQQLRQLA